MSHRTRWQGREAAIWFAGLPGAGAGSLRKRGLEGGLGRRSPTRVRGQRQPERPRSSGTGNLQDRVSPAPVISISISQLPPERALWPAPGGEGPGWGPSAGIGLSLDSALRWAPARVGGGLTSQHCSEVVLGLHGLAYLPTKPPAPQRPGPACKHVLPRSLCLLDGAPGGSSGPPAEPKPLLH